MKEQNDGTTQPTGLQIMNVISEISLRATKATLILLAVIACRTVHAKNFKKVENAVRLYGHCSFMKGVGLKGSCSDSFDIEIHETPQSEYVRIVKGNPSTLMICDSCPVESIEWAAADEYCRSQGKLLPTYAQWAFAVSTCNPEVTSDSVMFLDYVRRIAWGARNSGGRPHPVGSLPPNGCGIHDLFGNVWEMLRDVVPAESLSVEFRGSLFNRNSISYRSIAGGAWETFTMKFSLYKTDVISTTSRSPTAGFRCVKEY